MAIQLVRTRSWIAVAAALAVLLAPAVTARSRDGQQRLPDSLTNTEFARLMAEFGEPGGAFHSDNFTSNEAQIGAAARALSSRPAGGVYIGVGPEQNFTLIAAARPRLAFILDIRRQAIVQHLLFKALFELSDDRADFLSRLFARARPAALPPSAPLAQIWDAIQAAPADEARYRDQRRVVEAHLRETRGLPLPASDLAHLDYVFKAFFELGPGINYGGYQRGLSTGNVDFARLSLMPDADGVLRSFLGSEENFRLIRDLHRRNLIVPIEGDFAGPKALRAIGDYVRSFGAVVDVFYISNVEQYLFGQTVAKQTDINGGFKAFFENAASLPRNDDSAFIRSASLMSPSPLCPMTKFLDIARTRPITTQQDTSRCAGLTATPAPAPQPPVARQSGADAFNARARSGTDVLWLEGIATSEEMLRREWLTAVGTDQVPGDLRASAYARLGAIGTAESLAASRRIEAALRNQPTLASPALTGWSWPSAAAGISAGRMIAVNSVQSGEREYAVVLSEIDGPFAPFILMRSRADGRWQRPRLAGAPVPNAASFEPVLTLDGESLSIAFRRRPPAPETVPVPAPVVVTLSAITLDTDADGWTDLEEHALGMRHDRADTDDDGIPDGSDSSPLYKAADGEDRDDEAQILRRAMFVAYGLSGSRYAVFVAPGHRPVQLYGHSGPVFFNVALPDRTGCGRGARPGTCAAIAGGAQVAWTLSRPAPTDAVVQFRNVQGLGFRSTSQATLRKIGGEWVVVDYRVTGMN